MKPLLFSALVLGVLAGFPRTSFPQKEREFDALTAALVLEKTLVKTIAAAEPSVVSIARIKQVERNGRKPDFFGPIEPDRSDPTGPDFVPNEFGSGIIIAPLEKSDERFILTNYHVVKGGPVDKAGAGKADSKLYVRLANRRGFYAKIIAADPRSDLAVLRIDYKKLKMKPADLKPLKFSANKTFRKGQLVISLGNPYAQARDGSASASWGMIANISRRPKPAGKGNAADVRKRTTLHHLGTLLHVDTRLSIGTSGGALLNLKGELIGITTSLAALEGYESTVGYAVPFTPSIRRIVKSLAKGLEVEYGFLGVSPQNVGPGQDTLPRGLQLPRRFQQQHAAFAKLVHVNSPAARGGVTNNDVILGVDGRPVYDTLDLMRLVGELPPGSKTRLRIWRGRTGKELQLDVRLGKWPVVNDGEIVATVRRSPPWRGLSVDYPTARSKFFPNPPRFYRAVVLLKVAKELRERVDLQPGDFISHVNGTAVETPAQFHAAVRNLKGAVTLKVNRDDTVETVRLPE